MKNPKKKRTKPVYIDEDIEKRLEEGEYQMRFLDVDVGKTTELKLVFKKWPGTQWGIGILVSLIGLMMLYYLTEGVHHHQGFLFMKYDATREKRIKWWHYATSLCISLLGLIFIYSGKVYVLEINKETQQIIKTKTSVFC